MESQPIDLSDMDDTQQQQQLALDGNADGNDVSINNDTNNDNAGGDNAAGVIIVGNNGIDNNVNNNGMVEVCSNDFGMNPFRKTDELEPGIKYVVRYLKKVKTRFETRVRAICDSFNYDLPTSFLVSLNVYDLDDINYAPVQLEFVGRNTDTYRTIIIKLHNMPPPPQKQRLQAEGNEYSRAPLNNTNRPSTSSASTFSRSSSMVSQKPSISSSGVSSQQPSASSRGITRYFSQQPSASSRPSTSSGGSALFSTSSNLTTSNSSISLSTSSSSNMSTSIQIDLTQGESSSSTQSTQVAGALSQETSSAAPPFVLHRYSPNGFLSKPVKKTAKRMTGTTVRPNNIADAQQPSTSHGGSTQFNNICKVCYECEGQVVLLQCGHMGICMPCIKDSTENHVRSAVRK